MGAAPPGLRTSPHLPTDGSKLDPAAAEALRAGMQRPSCRAILALVLSAFRWARPGRGASSDAAATLLAEPVMGFWRWTGDDCRPWR